MIHNDIEMRITFDSPPESGGGDALLVTGAIQITIDGKTLTALETSSNTNGKERSKMFDYSGKRYKSRTYCSKDTTSDPSSLALSRVFSK